MFCVDIYDIFLLLQDINPNDAGCCGIPVLSWYPSKKLKEQDQSKCDQSKPEVKDASRAGSFSLTNGIYKLFSCATPRFCACGSCLFCDSSYSQRKVFKGPKVPNTVYTEVVVNEPVTPQGSCFGWWYDKEHVPTSERVSSKSSPIYNPKSTGGSTENLEPMLRSRADDDDVVTQAPVGATSLPVGASPKRMAADLGRSAIIPWKTEFTGRRVIIEERDVGDLEESDVLFGGQTIERDAPADDVANTDDEDEEDTESKDDQETRQYRICFVESDTETVKGKSDSESSDSEHEADDVAAEMVEIPLTPYQFDKNSWNGRLELMESLQWNDCQLSWRQVVGITLTLCDGTTVAGQTWLPVLN